MTDNMAARTAALATQLDLWARATGTKNAKALVMDATDLYRAALAYVEAINQLVAQPAASAEQQARVLVEMQTWLYDEFEDHLKALKGPLDATINELYERSS